MFILLPDAFKGGSYRLCDPFPAADCSAQEASRFCVVLRRCEGEIAERIVVERLCFDPERLYQLALDGMLPVRHWRLIDDDRDDYGFFKKHENRFFRVRPVWPAIDEVYPSKRYAIACRHDRETGAIVFELDHYIGACEMIEDTDAFAESRLRSLVNEFEARATMLWINQRRLNAKLEEAERWK